MTAEEVSRRYQVPMKILEEYRSWGLCDAVKMVMEDWQYDDSDLEKLSMIMALHDMGFETQEVERYMKLSLQGKVAEKELLKMLDRQRSETLKDIHLREQQLLRLDYLRTEMKNK